MTVLWHGGVTRLVILTKHWAVKLPTPMYGWKFFLYGFLANLQEREWAGFDARFCPVSWSSRYGIALVMPRCTPLTDEEFRTEIGEDYWRTRRVPFHPRPRFNPVGLLYTWDEETPPPPVDLSTTCYRRYAQQRVRAMVSSECGIERTCSIDQRCALHGP